jgi:hypothetical protein
MSSEYIIYWLENQAEVDYVNSRWFGGGAERRLDDSSRGMVVFAPDDWIEFCRDTCRSTVFPHARKRNKLKDPFYAPTPLSLPG